MTLKVIKSFHFYLMSSLDQFSVIFVYVDFYRIYTIYKTLKINISKKVRKDKEGVKRDNVCNVLTRKCHIIWIVKVMAAIKCVMGQSDLGWLVPFGIPLN